MGTPNEEEKRRLKASCRRFLSGHEPCSMPDRLRRLADLAPDEPPDEYGAGSVVERLERRVAELLGKERAVFVPKGVIAQQAALRVWSERANRQALVIHPKSHLDLDERRPLTSGCTRSGRSGAAPTTRPSEWPTSRTSASSSSRWRSSCLCGAPASACRPGRS